MSGMAGMAGVQIRRRERVGESQLPLQPGRVLPRPAPEPQRPGLEGGKTCSSLPRRTALQRPFSFRSRITYPDAALLHSPSMLNPFG